MIIKAQHFDIWELVCPHIYYRDGERAWAYLNPKQLANMDWVRNKYGPVYVNNWHEPQWINSAYVQYIIQHLQSGQPIIVPDQPAYPETMFTERGLRCNLCKLVYDKTQEGVLYLSAHELGDGDDYDVQGRTADEVRGLLVRDQAQVPNPFRLEQNVPWVHMDCEDNLTGTKYVPF
jgi:hypothetical protein